MKTAAFAASAALLALCASATVSLPAKGDAPETPATGTKADEPEEPAEKEEDEPEESTEDEEVEVDTSEDTSESESEAGTTPADAGTTPGKYSGEHGDDEDCLEDGTPATSPAGTPMPAHEDEDCEDGEDDGAYGVNAAEPIDDQVYPEGVEVKTEDSGETETIPCNVTIIDENGQESDYFAGEAAAPGDEEEAAETADAEGDAEEDEEGFSFEGQTEKPEGEQEVDEDEEDAEDAAEPAEVEDDSQLQTLSGTSSTTAAGVITVAASVIAALVI